MTPHLLNLGPDLRRAATRAANGGDLRGFANERLHVDVPPNRSRLSEALEAVFPRLARHLGQSAFDEIATAYVSDHPARHPSLRLLGAALADWVDERRPRAPWLSDLARLEWARSDVLGAIDEVVLSLDALLGVSPQDLVDLPLRLIGAHAIVLTDHDTAALWNAAGAGVAVDPSRKTDDRHGQILLVWRQDTAVHHRVLTAEEATALERVAIGATFGEICEMLARALPPEQAAARAFLWLSTWAGHGLLAG